MKDFIPWDTKILVMYNFEGFEPKAAQTASLLNSSQGHITPKLSRWEGLIYAHQSSTSTGVQHSGRPWGLDIGPGVDCTAILVALACKCSTQSCTTSQRHPYPDTAGLALCEFSVIWQKTAPFRCTCDMIKPDHVPKQPTNRDKVLTFCKSGTCTCSIYHYSQQSNNVIIIAKFGAKHLKHVDLHADFTTQVYITLCTAPQNIHVHLWKLERSIARFYYPDCPLHLQCYLYWSTLHNVIQWCARDRLEWEHQKPCYVMYRRYCTVQLLLELTRNICLVPQKLV